MMERRQGQGNAPSRPRRKGSSSKRSQEDGPVDTSGHIQWRPAKTRPFEDASRTPGHCPTACARGRP